MAWKLPAAAYQSEAGLDAPVPSFESMRASRTLRFVRPRGGSAYSFGGATQRKPRTPEHKRSRTDVEVDDEEDDDNIGETLLAQVLQNTFPSRQMEGTLNAVVIMLREHRITVAAERAGQAYHTLFQQMGANHPHGPPRLAKFSACLDEALKAAPPISEELKYLQRLRTLLDKSSPPEAGLIVRSFYVKGMYDKPGAAKMDRISFRLEGFFIKQCQSEQGETTWEPVQWHASFLKVLLCLEAQPKLGAAPRRRPRATDP